MKLHEYQAKQIFKENGIPIPNGQVVKTASAAATAAFAIGGKVVVKAQVHAGGRGKAGGIKVVDTPGAAESAAKEMLGSNIVTFQTGPDGVPVETLLIEEAIDIYKEIYLGMVIDGASKGVVVIASESGGMNIEEIAETSPEKIIQVPIDPVVGLQPFIGRKIAYKLNFPQTLIRPMTSIIQNLYQAFTSSDASLAEINPLVLTNDGEIVAADAKLDVDDDAIFRQNSISNMADPSQDDPLEAEAKSYDINYVKLDGTVGCIVNGAGLAMATMDMITQRGGQPANFLDIGGGASPERVAKAFELVLQDASVKAMLVNIYAGINRCDWIAEGVVKALTKMELKVPLVVRLSGTNVEEGKKIIADSKLPIIMADTLAEAAEKAVEASQAKS